MIEVISSVSNRRTKPRLPSYIPFQIIVKACHKNFCHNIIDEGASVIILSSNAWQYLGSAQLGSVIKNLLAFNRRVSEPLSILPKLPITMEGNLMVYIDVMVV